MHDAEQNRPDHARLFDLASARGGYFTASDAAAAGFGKSLVSHHVKMGRFLRVARGVYRLRDYPTSTHEETMAAWLTAGGRIAAVSHESALDLHGLSDVVPNKVHLTLPRTKRYRSPSPGVAIHTTSRRLGKNDVTILDGIRLTSPGRTIVDAAESGTAPEQIETAVTQAIERGVVTRAKLLAAAKARGRRVHRLISDALNGTSTP